MRWRPADVAQRLQLSGPGADRFQHSAMVGLGLMTLLGFSVASALLASSSAIMAAAPKEKAAAAGAIEPWPMSWARSRHCPVRPDPDPQLQRHCYCPG